MVTDHEMRMEALRLFEDNERLAKALKWYAQEAEAAARYMALGKAATADALLAILTVLANDGGKRARSALALSSKD